ncbi:MAG: glycosyltransferase [Nibricoccus sp.]
MNPLSFDSPLPRIGMVSTHGYVAATPPLGAADTGGQVVYVLELSKKLAQLGFEVDIWTRRFEDQPEIDVVNERVRVIRIPCGGKKFIGKEYLVDYLAEWSENALRFINRHGLKYHFFNSHYWDAGVATQRLTEALDVPHIHTPHSLGLWKKQLMEKDSRTTPQTSKRNTTSPSASVRKPFFTAHVTRLSPRHRRSST